MRLQERMHRASCSSLAGLPKSIPFARVASLNVKDFFPARIVKHWFRDLRNLRMAKGLEKTHAVD